MGLLRNSRKGVVAPLKKKSITLQHLFELDSPKNYATNVSKESSSDDPESEEFMSLITYCSSTIYTFSDPKESPLQQDVKKNKLTRLLSLIKSSNTTLNSKVMSSMFEMLSVNLFRAFPPTTNSTKSCSSVCVLPDDEELSATPTAAWPHLQIVYEILQRILTKTDTKLLQDYITRAFLLSLLPLFRSEDTRERESLKNIYHQIYSKLTFCRSFMRKAMNDVFLLYIFECDHKHCGIGDLLEIWGSIINGFSLPLKEEHMIFLTKVLIPLHKAKGLQAYQRQLAYCVSQFVQKDSALGEIVIRGILRYWPLTNCQKEVLLIGEMEDLIQNIHPQYYVALALPVCTQITKCLNSWNSQVAERALYMWNNEKLVKMASQAIEQVFPVVVEGMEKNIKYHWSKNVKQLTENVKEMLREQQPDLYDKCLSQLQVEESAALGKEMKRKEMWDKVHQMAENCATPCLVSN